MEPNDKNSNGRVRKRPRYALFGALAVVAAIALAIVWMKVINASEDPTADFATFVAKRGPLTIKVAQTGSIRSRERITIKNEVEGRTSIISLVPEGTYVKKDDLLIELDTSTLSDLRINQEIATKNAHAAYINAVETLAVAQNQAQSDIDIAELTLKFAEQDLEQYKQGQYPKERKTAENDITLRKEEQARANETLKWSQTLFDEKYLSNTDLQADKLAVTRSNNNLELAEAELRLLEEFTYQRNIDQLESDLHQAKMALERTKRKARADVVQAEADLDAKQLEYTRQDDKLTKLKDQISKATIYAPADGMVIYATSVRRGWRDNRDPLDEGVEVFERQDLIYLPVANKAIAEVDIHEAYLEKVRLGLPAIVTVDALAGKTFFGTVGLIAPLPDPQSMWMNPDLKIYESEIHLEGDSPDLRTGMSCKVEIIVEQYEDVVYIPVQAVIRVAGQPTAYVLKDGVIEERPVEIGLDNNRMIVIASGIEEGETVLLTPPLQSAAVEDGAMTFGSDDSPTGTSDTMRQRINRTLEEANGAAAGPSGRPGGATGPDRQRPSPPGGDPGQGDRPRQGGPGGGARGPDRGQGGRSQDSERNR